MKINFHYYRQTGAEYAIKIVDKYKCQGKEAMLASEVAILRQVCHPNIISLIDEQETTDQLYLVMELVKVIKIKLNYNRKKNKPGLTVT